ncbi:MAG TPA: 50S ribosomal protein L21 [Anaerolineales bacterium]
MKFAIVESGGKQYRAVEGGTLEVDRLPVEAGANVKLEQVLLLADGDAISVGTPLIKNTPIWTTVIEHFKGPKVNTFNYSPKKRIRVKIGHRQNYTRLRVEQIGGSEWVKKEPVKVERVVEAEAEKVEKTSQTAPRTAARVAETKAAVAKPSNKTAPKSEGKTSSKKNKPAAKKPATKAPAKAKTPVQEKKPAAASSKKNTPAKAETKKKTSAASPKGKKPATK